MLNCLFTCKTGAIFKTSVCTFQTIVGYPPTKALSSEEKDLVWKFRFYLSSQKTV